MKSTGCLGLLLACFERLQGKFPLYLGLWHKDIWEVDVKFQAFVSSAFGGGEFSVLHSSFFTYGKKQKAAWDTELIGQG
jgi:hypothetical protein